MLTLLVLLGLAAATLILRVPLLTPRLAHWDAVNYALGLHDFNIAAHQPHPPGSPYFILLGRAALLLVGDDNAALSLIALVASVLAVVGEYAFIRMLFGPRAALLGALVLMTQPIFWGYGIMGNAWALLAALAIGTGAMCVLLVRRHTELVVPSALFLGIASGFRADVVAFLAPLWVWSLWRAKPGARQAVLALAILIACVLGWVVVVTASAGGPVAWLERLAALLPPTDAPSDAKARQLAANTAISFGIFGLMVGPAVLVSLILDARRTVCWLRSTLCSEMALFWALAILPAFAFLWLIDSTEPGHDLVFAGALVALAAGLLDFAARTTARVVVSGALVIVFQAGLFLLAAPQYDEPLNWTMDAMLLNITAPGLRQEQQSLDAALQTIHGFDPRATAVLTLVGQDTYRFMMYYLPEYRVLQLNPTAHAALVAYGRQPASWTEVGDCLFADRVRNVVLVVSHFGVPGIIPPDATLASNPETPRPFEVWQLKPDGATPTYLGFDIGTNCRSG